MDDMDENIDLEDEKDLLGTELMFGEELPSEVLATLKLIGKKWSLPILYMLHEKNMGFSELKKFDAASKKLRSCPE